jgi:hypothetical protein
MLSITPVDRPPESHSHSFSARFRDCYTQNLWLLNPLHPAALEDDNIRHAPAMSPFTTNDYLHSFLEPTPHIHRYIMCTDEGAEERSPLSLSIYWILYSGALMAGHVERAVEFYSKARYVCHQHLISSTFSLQLDSAVSSHSSHLSIFQ